MKSNFIAVLLAVTTVALCGCGNNGPASQAAARRTIAVVPPAMTSTFYIDIAKGAKQAARELGYDLKMPSPKSESDFLEQVNMVETLVSQNIDAIAVCAINNEAICAAVKKANDAGIPFFIFNALEDLPDDTVKVKAWIGYDQHKAGKRCGEYILAGLREKHGSPKGKVVILRGLPGFHDKIRAAGFKEGIEAAAHPEIVIEEYPAKWRRDEGKRVMEGVLSKDRDIDAVYGCNDGMAQGAARAARDAGIDLVTVGIDGNADTLDDVKQGIVTGTLAVFPVEIGRITVETMDRVLNGQTVEAKIETPIQLVTAENIDSFIENTK